MTQFSGDFNKNLDNMIDLFKKRNDIDDIKTDGNLYQIVSMLTEIATDSVIGQESAILNANLSTTASSSVILNKAADLIPNYLPFATPAKVKCTMSIPDELLINKTTTLSKDVSFTIGNNKYCLMDDISILKADDGKYYTKYLNSSHHMVYNKNSQPVNGRLYNTMQTTSAGSTNLLIHDVHILQLEFDEKPISFPDLETLLKLSYAYDIGNNKQLCGINILYKKSLQAQFNEIPFYTKEMVYDDPAYIYFKMISDTSFKFYFSNILEGFTPNVNDSMNIRLYYTDGAGANGQRSSTYAININSLAITLTIDGGFVENGRDKKTIEETRTQVERLRQNPKLETITTDFEHSLIAQNGMDNVNSDVKIYRYRDDLYRSLRAFTTLKDSNGKIIPTNTINLTISYREFKKLGNKLTPNDVIIYDDDTHIFRLLKEDEVNYIYNRNHMDKKHTYASPFLIRLGKYINDSNGKLGIYYAQPSMVYVNETYDMIETEMKTYDLVGIFKHLKVVRDPYDTSYKVYFTFNDKNNIESLRSNIYFEIVFKDKDGHVIGVNKKLFDSSINNTVSFELHTEDTFLPNDFKLLIHNSLYKNQSDPSLELTSEFDEIFDAEINVYGKAEAFSLLTDGNQDIINLGGEKFILTNKYTVNDMSLFRRMDRYFDTNLYLDDNSTFTLNIPVVSNFYLKDMQHFNYIVGELNAVYDVIDELLKKIIDNATISIKFINSCGPAHLTHGLTKTDITMKIGVTLALDTNDVSGLKIQHAKAIADYIETINNGDIKVSQSSLLSFIQGLESVESASIISFNGLMAMDDVYSSINDLDNRYSIREDVPEYVNVAQKIKTGKDGMKFLDYAIDFIIK